MDTESGHSPSGPGHSGFAPSPDGLGHTASVLSADEFENDTQRGYAAFEAGGPFDKFQSAEWADGWQTASDYRWWQTLARALGGSVHGFSFRHSGSLIIRGEVHSLSGSLLEAVAQLIDAASAIEAATAGETAQTGSTEGESAARDSEDAQPSPPRNIK